MELNELSSLEAEQALLGAILLESSIFSEVKTLISSKDFFYKQNRIIYENMIQTYDKEGKVDLVILMQNIKDNGLLDATGGMSYLTKLTTVTYLTSMYKQYCRMIKDMAIKRLLKDQLQDQINNLSKMDVSDIADNLDKIKNITDGAGAFSSLYKSFGQIISQEGEEKLSTGFLRVDRALYGLELGSLLVITGEPSSGKSTILNQIIAFNLKNGEKALIYSGELKETKVKGWFTTTVANEKHIYEYVDQYGKTRWGVTKYGADLISKWADDKLFIFKDNSKPSLKNIIGSIRSLHSETGARLIILDNLMTMTTEKSYSDKNQKQIEIVSAIKDLAKELGLVIILVAHANKESAKSKEPHMFDISGASEIPNLADYILKTMRDVKKDEYGNEIADKTVLFISKNRAEGEQNVGIRTYYNKKRRRFETDDRTELNVNYGYDENDKFEQVSTNDIPFRE